MKLVMSSVEVLWYGAIHLPMNPKVEGGDAFCRLLMGSPLKIPQASRLI